MVNIKVVNRQRIDGEDDTVREEAHGKIYIKNGKTYIIYTTNDGSSSNMIIAAEKTVTVKRRGETSSVMEFDKTRRTRTTYRMPYGNMPMEIETEKIVNALTEDGGKLRLVYTVSMQGQRICNDMRIIVERMV